MAAMPHELARFEKTHLPSANPQATITQAAAGGQGINVCTDLTVTIAATGSAPTAANLQVNLIDGASGGTTYLWRSTISIPATAGATATIAIAFPHGKKGSANTAMTLEFSGAGGANTVESVALGGYTVL